MEPRQLVCISQVSATLGWYANIAYTAKDVGVATKSADFTWRKLLPKVVAV